MARIFFYILLGLAGFFLLRTVISLLGSAPSANAGRGGSGGGSKMVKDPVCGIYIPEERAMARRIGGEVRHFCSEQCADEFSAAHHPP
ncbi:MAG: YHS domain-containing protein [Nitrospirae bacterium]|nr:YHS domain-containing protein [Nitrospirota bacterium]